METTDKTVDLAETPPIGEENSTKITNIENIHKAQIDTTTILDHQTSTKNTKKITTPNNLPKENNMARITKKDKFTK